MVTRVPSAVRTRVMRTRGLGSGAGAGAAALRVTRAGLAWRVLRAAAVDCAAAAGDAADGGRATADAPPPASGCPAVRSLAQSLPRLLA
jgi:hypothetical protein